MEKFASKTILVLIILSLGGFILIFSVKDSPQFDSQKQINQKVNILSEQEKCETSLSSLTQKRPFCQDLNFCPEPCWPELRAEITHCLQLKGESVNPEKIEGYLKNNFPPAWFAESRAACKSWAKTDQELKDCLRGYEQTCSKK
ncbi:MAG: hypothetical protein WC460_00235 [Patescibacteria group bacterium]